MTTTATRLIACADRESRGGELAEHELAEMVDMVDSGDFTVLGAVEVWLAGELECDLED